MFKQAIILSLVAAVGVSAQRPEVYYSPEVCGSGIVLAGKCITCPGTSSEVPILPTTLKSENGQLVCECPADSCVLSTLTEEQLATLASIEGDAVYVGVGEI